MLLNKPQQKYVNQNNNDNAAQTSLSKLWYICANSAGI